MPKKAPPKRRKQASSEDPFPPKPQNLEVFTEQSRGFSENPVDGGDKTDDSADSDDSSADSTAFNLQDSPEGGEAEESGPTLEEQGFEPIHKKALRPIATRREEKIPYLPKPPLFRYISPRGDPRGFFSFWHSVGSERNSF